MASLQKRGNVWYATYKSQDKWHTKSTKGKSKKDARDLASKWERDAWEREELGIEKERTDAECREDYFAYLETKGVSEKHLEDVKRILALGKVPRGKSARTRKKYLAVLKTFYTFCVRRGWKQMSLGA